MDELEPYTEQPDEVFDPAYEAHQARLQGKSWKQAAEIAGYPNTHACFKAVGVYLQSAAVAYDAKKKSESLDMELERLDALQATWWYAATNGDDKAAQIVLKTISQRSKLLGLEDMQGSETKGSKTILVMGDKGNYANTLQALAEGKFSESEEED